MTSRIQTTALPAPVAINRSAWPRRLKGLLLPVLILLVLEVVVRIGWLPSYQMPAPSEIAVTLTDLAEGALWKHISASLLRVLAGFTIGASLALIFAAWVGLSREAKPTWSQRLPGCAQFRAWPGYPCCCCGWASMKPRRSC